MFTKTKLALAVALVLGAASAVQANDTDRNDQGGFRVGPLGQRFQGANPAYHPSMRHGGGHPSMRHDGGGAYAFVPEYRFPARPYRNAGETRFERNWFGYQDCPGTEGDC